MVETENTGEVPFLQAEVNQGPNAPQPTDRPNTSARFRLTIQDSLFLWQCFPRLPLAAVGLAYGDFSITQNVMFLDASRCHSRVATSVHCGGAKQ